MKRTLFIFHLLMVATLTMTAQSLEECQRAAEANYPLIQQYDLIAKTTELNVANIQKGWLPQVSGSAQATYQSDVTAWPDEMKAMLNQMGVDVKGLRKDQYRVGIDVQQTVFDGGLIKNRAAIAREQGKVQSAQTEVNIYNVRRRVNEMYFSMLMLDEQLRLNLDLQVLLEGNERKLASMVKGGTASESDLMNVRAERLKAVQRATELESQRNMLQKMLATFCGIEMKGAQKPVLSDDMAQLSATAPSLGDGQAVRRPELKAIDAQLGLINAQEKALDAALLPKLGVFAQGFYGYPGYNMFEDMMNHKWSLNGMVGARLTWNIGSLYTRKNDKAKLNVQRSQFNVQRETFLFNNNLDQIQQGENIKRYRRLMDDDEEIISLRTAVRKAAESKLAHGIIDVNDLVREINQENAARVQQSMHEILMLKEIFDYKYTINN